MKIVAALILLTTPLAASPVPSGQEATLHEVLVDAQESKTYLRFRYITPQIGPGAQKVSFEVAGNDMLHLCETFALPYIDQYALEADTIVISFMDRITEFGMPDPDAIQYFESFRSENGVCMWDEF